MEPPVVRSRGRPRKRRRKEDEDEGKTVPDAKGLAVGTRPIALVGRYVLKEFPRNGVFLGKVAYYESGLYRVNYEDGDYEDLDSGEVRPILLNDGDFDDDLARRRGKLEELMLQKSEKVADMSEKGSVDSNKEVSAVDVPASSELNDGLSIENNEEDDDEADVDSSRDSESDSETPPVPPPLQLPPSSGTIGVPEPYVSHLFSVYGFLRSFSTRLFLLPFTLDEFVGSLNCRVSNTLFDAVHVSLMRALRHRLETLSSEGSELASHCLRCNDWSLLDTLTWPVFVIQYLLVSGYTKGPEWKGFYDEIISGEYYLLPVSRKLVILQILCDDVLESDELKAEMNMREESEVGMDYDAEDILPAEMGTRRVHPRYAKTSACNDKEAMQFVPASNAVSQPGNSLSYFRDTKSTEDGDVDRNGDECRLCGMDGTLLCCDGCPSAYHSRCIGVMKMFIPEGPWYCPECKINMTGPTIAKGTALKGAEIFGMDLYGQLFIGTCDHLLVLNIDNDEFHLKYYNQNDIPKVLQVLCDSMQHRPIYYGICMAVLRYWNVPENFLPLSVSTGTIVNSASIKEETKFSTSLLPPLGEDNHKPVSLGKGEYPLTTVSLIHTDNMVPSLYASSVTTQSPAPESSVSACSKEHPTVDTKIPEETRMESVISAGSVSVSYQSDVSYRSSLNRPTTVDPAKCALVNSRTNYYGHANDMGLPMSFSLQTKESTQAGFGKSEGNVTNDFGYMGFSYKPQSYINYYMHGDFAASAAAKFAVLSSEESRSEGHISDNQKKTASGNTYLQAKAFSLTASRFFWPSSEKKLVEVPRERCGWCFSCKAPVSSKRGCMLNHAALSVTKSAMKIFAGFSPIRSGEGILPSIATYIIYMEECLRGLIVGPFLTASYKKQWRNRVEQATTFSAIKPLLLKLEENIRMIAFCGDWIKLVDDWLVRFSVIQNAAPSLGTTQKRVPSGRRYKKRSAADEATADGCHENFVWWRGSKFTKFIFQKAVLPKSMVKKAARQGGWRKISGILYADGSEIPKRSRQLVWRVAVQMSRNASQLALQVRYLDFYLRWSDLIRPEQNIQDGKGQETEASAFRNANICDRKLVEGKSCYGIAFGNQKHLPSRVMKSVVEIEQGPEGKEKYWFSETRIPLYLIKEYEEGNKKVPSDEEHLSVAPQLSRRKLKATCKDIFFYLTCKRDNLVMLSCSVCLKGVLIRNAHKCNACQGYCHEGCSMSSAVSGNGGEYLTTCKQCYHAKLLSLKETSNESPTSPLLLQGRQNSSRTVLKGPGSKCHDETLKSARTKASHTDMNQVTSMTVLKGPRPKFYDQALTSTRTKDSPADMKQVASDSTLAAKSRRKNCSWGIIWKKKNNESTDIDFRLKNILLKGGSGMPQLEPVCHLCRQPYRSDLMYIRCETCQHWYHAEAVELEESKIFCVLGFKCCKCRRIKSPVCPYSDLKLKTQEGKKSHTRASKKEHSGADSDSGTFSDVKECEAATPVFPVEDDPLLFSLSSVELITEPKLDVDVEWNTVSGPVPQKLPVRRHVKVEGDDDGSFGGKPSHAEFSTHNEAGNLSKSTEVLSPLEYDSAVRFDNDLLIDSESLNCEYTEFEPHTYFSVTELLHPGDGGQFEEVDVSGDLSGYLENSSTLVPEEYGGFSLVDKSDSAISLQDSVYSCWKCSQMEPAPDLCCEICGILIHSQCSPWVESPSRLGSWRCGNCREWQ
ncbi:DDT domain-containing protein PTM-like [Gastrolobium bilobum]|uniref:DDT domain-containing protein PTM-like n=1 Tax=Gastrolobium bilobum TaxID=150636 RepID=UPI002AAFC4F6|nr:DDT domain-containing protein PTM-like [Gastrolobium bilobum]